MCESVALATDRPVPGQVVRPPALRRPKPAPLPRAARRRGATNTEAAAVAAEPDDDDDDMEARSSTRPWARSGAARRGGRMPEPTRFGDWERKGAQRLLDTAAKQTRHQITRRRPRRGRVPLCPPGHGSAHDGARLMKAASPASFQKIGLLHRGRQHTPSESTA